MAIHPLPPIQFTDPDGDPATLGEVNGVTMANSVTVAATIGELRFFPDFDCEWDDLGLTSSIPKAGVTVTLATVSCKAKDGRSGTLGAAQSISISVTGKAAPPPPPPPPPPGTVKAAVEGLVTRATPNGQPRRDLPDIASLNLSGLSVTSTRATYTGSGGVIDGYSFGTREVRINGQLDTLKNCYFTQAYGVRMSLDRHIVVEAGGRIVNFDFNEIEGTYGDGAGAQKQVLCARVTGNIASYGGIYNFRRNRFIGHEMDCYGASGGLVEENYFGPPVTTPSRVIIWGAARNWVRNYADFRLAEFCQRSGSDEIYMARVDGYASPPGAAPPLNKIPANQPQDPNWQIIDLHGDAVTMLAAEQALGGLTIRRNFFDWRRADAPYDTSAANNCTRLYRNNGTTYPVYQVTVEENIYAHGSALERLGSTAGQLGGGGSGTNMFGPFAIQNNWMRSNRGGNYWYNQGSTGRWFNNLDYDTGAPVPPPYAGWTTT